MKTLVSKLTMLLWLVIFAQPLYATDYYFSDQSGNDNRSATEAQNPATPWKSIEKLNQIFPTLNPGDAVYFKRGDKFYGTIHIDKSGNAGNPIKIGAYGSGPKPIITSFVRENSWNQVGTSLYETTSALKTSDIQVVLINGKRVELGRFPNGDQNNEGYITINSVSNKNTISGDFPAGSSNWTGGDVVIKKMQWVIDVHKITSHSGSTVTFDLGSSGYEPKAGFGFFIQNHPNTLDKYGEWYFNPSTKKLRIHFQNENPANSVIEYASLPYLVTKNSRANHILLENLHFSGANKDAIFLSGGDDVKISKVDIDYTGEDGMHILSHTNLLIEECLINNTYNNGMYLRFGNDGAVIKNNKLTNISTEAGRTRNGDGSGVGIFAVSSNVLIEKNSVHSVGYNGIQFNGNNTIVKNNFVDTFCLIKGDGGGIYTFGGHNNPDVHNRKVVDNIIINGIGSKGGLAYITRSGFNPQAEGIFLDDNSNGIEIIGNSIANVNSGIKMSNSYNVKVTDNIFYNSNMLLNVGNSAIGKDTRNIRVEGNIFFAKYANQNAYTIRSHKNDILQMVTFDKNNLFRPFGDVYGIFTRNPNSSGTFVENIYNLERWAKETGNDVGSKSHTVDFEKFIIQERTSKNLFPNMQFNTNTSGLSGNNTKLTWVNGQIDGGTLEALPSDGGSLKIDIGKVEKNRDYLVKFKAKAEKNVPIRLNLRHTGSPWSVISTVNTIDLERNTKEYQLILTSDVDVDKASVMVILPESNVRVWMDDLEIVQVNVKHVLPEDKIIFEYNNSNSPKNVSLNGIYVDAKNTEYSGNIIIQPYKSLALFRMGNEEPKITPEIEEPQAPEITGELIMNFGSTDPVVYENRTYGGENLSYFTSTTSISQNEISSLEPLFQTGRFNSSVNISIPVSNGTYTVKTYHHETYFGIGGRPSGPGQRVFDINIQGKLLKKDFDLFLENANQETVLTFEKIEVVNNILTLNLTASVNNALISGISISKSDSSIETPVTEPEYEIIEVANPSSNQSLLSINTFATKSISFNGQEFTGDGSKYLKSTSTRVSSNTLASNEELFQSAIFASEIDFEIPVPNGKYIVKTYHNETYFGVSGPTARVNQRVFDIIIEGKVVKEKLDMFAEYGNKEIELTFEEIEVKDRILNISLKASVNNAVISGISIFNLDGPVDNLISETIKEAVEITNPDTNHAMFSINTFATKSVSFNGQEFTGDGSKYLKSTSTRISSNTLASKEELFQSGRFSTDIDYEIPVPNGKYIVKTYHNETHFGVSGPDPRINQRVFDIIIEGKVVKEKMDMFAEFGNKETIMIFEEIEVKDQILNISLKASVNNALISAFSVTPIQEEIPQIAAKPTGVYFSTGNQGNVEYETNSFQRIPADFLKTSSTNVSNNSTASTEPLFQSGRFSKTLNYAIPLPDGIYTIETYHKETFFGLNGRTETVGQRVFDIAIEGQIVKAGLDMFAEYSNKEVKLIFKDIKVTGGQLNIDLNAHVNNAIISGIGIVDESGKNLLDGSNLRGYREMEQKERDGEVVKPMSSQTKAILYPNPAKDVTNLSVQSENEPKALYIHNMGGQLIKVIDPARHITSPGIITIPTSDVKDGLYLITLVDTKGDSVKMRLIVKH
jgi:hypothetical protein